MRLARHVLQNTSKIESSFRNYQTSTSLLVRKNNAAETKEKKIPEGGIGYDDEHQTVLKVCQRFNRDLRSLSRDKQPFAIIEKGFMGKVMSTAELRPERGFANFVPIGLMFIRLWYRRLQAIGNFQAFNQSGIFNEDEIRSGTKKAFELITQSVYKGNLEELVSRGVCNEETVERFQKVAVHMSPYQKELLNIKEEDIYAIAPGVFGPYQMIRPRLHEKTAYLTRSLLCCAFYKKDVLYKAVEHLPLLDNAQEGDLIKIPQSYGYEHPRIVMAYITFGNKCVTPKEIDQEVKLVNFQLIVM